MLCQKCGEYIALYYDVKNKIALCPFCAEKMESANEIITINNSEFAFGFPNQIDSLFGSLFNNKSYINEISQSTICPLCGSTFAELVNNGKVGCAKCYDIFKVELNNTINSIHGNVKHIGRSPKKLRTKIEKANKLEQLKSNLKTAIERQEFEEAAKLRDEIRNLESKEI